MALNREEICKRLSPDTITRAWHRDHYGPLSLRWNMNRTSVILFAIALGQHSVFVPLVCIFASLLLIVSLTPVGLFDTNQTIYWSLAKYAETETNSINTEAIAMIRSKSKNSEFPRLRFKDHVQQNFTGELLERASTLLKFDRLTLLRNTHPELVNNEEYDEAKRVYEQALAQQEWINRIEASLNVRAQCVIHLLRRPHSLDMATLSHVVNSYADTVLNAIEQPFPNLAKAA